MVYILRSSWLIDNSRCVVLWKWYFVALLAWMELGVFCRGAQTTRWKGQQCIGSRNVKKNLMPKYGLGHSSVRLLGNTTSLANCVDLCCKHDQSSIALFVRRQCYGVTCDPADRAGCQFVTRPTSNSRAAKLKKYSKTANRGKRKLLDQKANDISLKSHKLENSNTNRRSSSGEQLGSSQNTRAQTDNLTVLVTPKQKKKQKKSSVIKIKLDHKTLKRLSISRRTFAANDSTEHRNLTYGLRAANNSHYHHLKTMDKRQSLLDDPRFKNIPRTYIKPINFNRRSSTVYQPQGLHDHLASYPQSFVRSYSPLMRPESVLLPQASNVYSQSRSQVPEIHPTPQYLAPRDSASIPSLQLGRGQGSLVQNAQLRTQGSYNTFQAPALGNGISNNAFNYGTFPVQGTSQSQQLDTLAAVNTQNSTPSGFINGQPVESNATNQETQEEDEGPRTDAQKETQGSHEDYDAVEVVPATEMDRSKGGNSATSQGNKSVPLTSTRNVVQSVSDADRTDDDADDVDEPEQHVVVAADSARSLVPKNTNITVASFNPSITNQTASVSLHRPTRRVFVPTLDIPLPERTKILKAKSRVPFTADLAVQWPKDDKTGDNVRQRETTTDDDQARGIGGGQDTGCWQPLGLGSKFLSNENFIASSHSGGHPASQARLSDNSKGWCADKKHAGAPQFLQVDLGAVRTVCRVATKGNEAGWTKRFKIASSHNGGQWQTYKEHGKEKVFPANIDSKDSTFLILKQPITAKYVRFLPINWQGDAPCLKLELYNNSVSDHTGTISGRSAIPAVHTGLVEDLTFEKMDEDTVLDQSPFGNNGFLDHGAGVYDTHSSCRHAAALQRGGDMQLDGKSMRQKPRDAITVSAWLALDDTNGTHSIFDTIGGHSMHQQGQFHFEIVNGVVRWFHRNETGEVIFNVTTDSSVVSPKLWHSLVATYDASFQLAKIYVNGSLRGLGNGQGLISQDWDAKAGVGRHKDGRFLNGYIDEFKIFDEALSEDKVADLAVACDFKTYYCGTTLTAEKGLLVTPDFPLTHKGPMLCIWEIEGKPGEVISLNVKEFDLGGDGDCSQSTLEVRDGQHDALIGSYCGSEKPRTIESHGHRMWIKYTSQGNNEGEKFKIVYERENKLSAKKTLATDQCALSKALVNVTLVGGAKAGNFTEIGKVDDASDCANRCCAKTNCDMGFMIDGYCYSVACFSKDLCRPRPARASTLFPTVALVARSDLAPPVQTANVADDTAKGSGAEPDTPSSCDNSKTYHNVTLVGGIKAGNFTSRGTVPDFHRCLSACCDDATCDAAFMVKGTCFNLQCTDPVLCAMKAAKPSSYNPTIAYVHRSRLVHKVAESNTKGIAKSGMQPKSCTALRPSKTFKDVTLKGGINAGEFVDKGKVFDAQKCLDYCCRDDGCNLAFVIRKTCFLVKCKSYDSCSLKPAVSRFYTPTVTYVNWNPPKEGLGDDTNSYDYEGCWRDFDMSAFAMPLLEGTDPLISGPYKTREDPVNDCATVTQKLGYKVFAIQNGGACFSGSDAAVSYKRYGGSTACKGGKGGPFANSVYKLFDDGSVISLGCWSDLQDRAFRRIEKTDPLLQDDYQKRQDPVSVCAKVARKQNIKYFALQKGGQCFAIKNHEEDYRKYGMSRKCKYGLGGQMANDVYTVRGLTQSVVNSSSQAAPPSANNSSILSDSRSPTEENTTSEAKTTAVTTTIAPTATTKTRTIPTPAPPQSPLPTRQNDTYTNKTVYKEETTDTETKTYTFSIGRLQENVTMSRGINAGTYDDKGKVDNMDECIHACGVEPTCDLAFMLGQQCFSVRCISEDLCTTKPAFSSFYNPRIAFIKHDVSSRQRLEGSTKTLTDKNCVHVHKVENVTLVAGIRAGNFSDLGPVRSIDDCVSRCCNVSTCEMAFKIENDCYGIRCSSKESCKTRPARNSVIFTPIVAYVRPITNKGVVPVVEETKAVAPVTVAPTNPTSISSSNCSKDQWEGQIRENQTLIGGIKAGDFTDHGERASIGDCMSECCAQPTCDLAFMIDKDCYSVRCFNPDMCNTRAAKPTKFHPVIAYKKRAMKGIMGDPVLGGATVNTETQLPTLALATQDGNAKSMTDSSSKHSCGATDPIHNSTLKMGMHSGVFTRLGHVRTMDECIERCCKSSNIDVAYMLGLMCFSVKCYSPELCKTSGVMTSSIANLNMNPTISFLNQDKKQQSNANDANEGNGAIDVDSADILTDTVDALDSDDSSLGSIGGDTSSRLTTTRLKTLEPTYHWRGNRNHKHSHTKRPSTNAFGYSSVALNPPDGGYTTYDTCQDSPVTYNVTLRGGISAGNFTEQGEGLTMNECIGKCCDATACDLAFMFSDKCYSVTCFREDLCQAVVAKPSALEPKIAYLSKNTKLNYIEDPGTSFELSSGGHQKCDARHLHHGPVYTNKTLVGGMQAGNFSFLGRVSDIKDCLQRCCHHSDCDLAYVIDGTCFSVDCFSKNLCEITSNLDVKSHVVISALVKEQRITSKRESNVGIYILIGVIVVAVGSAGILWAVCMYLKRKRIKARQRDSESEEAPMPDR